MIPESNEISIIIPVIEPHYLIEGCLNTLLSYTDEEGLRQIKEIAIIDNARESIWPLIAKYNRLLTKAEITILFYRPVFPLMHIDSCNLGLSITSAPRVILYNDDIEIPITQGDWLSKMNKLMDDHPDYGSITITTLLRDHRIYHYGTVPDAYLLHNKVPHTHIDYEKKYDFLPRPIHESDWNNFACVLIKRNTLENVPYDGIDPKGIKHLHYYCEQYHGRKIKKLGMKNVCYRDGTWIYHLNERVVKRMVQMGDTVVQVPTQQAPRIDNKPIPRPQPKPQPQYRHFRH